MKTENKNNYECDQRGTKAIPLALMTPIFLIFFCSNREAWLCFPGIECGRGSSKKGGKGEPEKEASNVRLPRVRMINAAATG